MTEKKQNDEIIQKKIRAEVIRMAHEKTKPNLKNLSKEIDFNLKKTTFAFWEEAEKLAKKGDPGVQKSLKERERLRNERLGKSNNSKKKPIERKNMKNNLLQKTIERMQRQINAMQKSINILYYRMNNREETDEDDE